MNSRVEDVARFAEGDGDALVLAALSCPFCLREDEIEWHLRLEQYDPHVRCRCSDCRRRWRVYLLPEQALRLSLVPPALAAPAR